MLCCCFFSAVIYVNYVCMREEVFGIVSTFTIVAQ